MRLIDADEYLAKAEHEAKAMPEAQGESFVMLTDWLLAKTPTAYDVDKAAEQIKRIGTSFCVSVNCNESCDDCDHGVMMNAILGEVKRGGADEENRD